MSKDNNHIKDYSANDIEKYHKGQLSAKDMHDMEKAAMDDPFLADALEGYAVGGVNASADISDLKERLAKRLGDAKVIPMGNIKRKSYTWLRVAVMLVFVAGAGLLIYQFGFNKKQADIAQAESKTTAPVMDSIRAVNPTTGNPINIPVTENTVASGNGNTPVAPKINLQTGESNQGIATTETKPGTLSEKDLSAGFFKAAEDETKKQPQVTPSVSAPTRSVDIRLEKDGMQADKTTDTKSVAKESNKPTDSEVMNRRDVAGASKNAPANRAAENFQYRSNVFRGQVTDAENRGVPFANVTNLTDNNAGTYTDARGFFNLTHPDSVLTVQVRSIGFENTNVQLRNVVPTNQVVLQDDRSSLDEVVLNKQKTNSVARKREDNMKIEEPEPADGWEKYDAYLLNNLNIPEEFPEKQKNTGTVELSFEVDKNGNPINIKVERSLCKSCDKEAIRLVKEGPKWKRKVKKGRTTVKVPF